MFRYFAILRYDYPGYHDLVGCLGADRVEVESVAPVARESRCGRVRLYHLVKRSSLSDGQLDRLASRQARIDRWTPAEVLISFADRGIPLEADFVRIVAEPVAGELARAEGGQP